MIKYAPIPIRNHYDAEHGTLQLPHWFLRRAAADLIYQVGRGVSEPVARSDIRWVWRRLHQQLNPAWWEMR